MDARGGEKKGGGSSDLYAVLGLSKECTDADLRKSYRKLAMKWHPDRCTAPASSKGAQEAKEKFQEIQGAYSVLSDSNKRFLYDVGVYCGDDSDDDNLEGMGDFLCEMAQMMNQAKSTGAGEESLQELQHLFVDMFQSDIDNRFFGPSAVSISTSSSSCNTEPNACTKRDNSEMEPKLQFSDLDGDSRPGAFCFGAQTPPQQRGMAAAGSSNRRRNGRKQKTSSKHDVSSCDAGLSA